MLEIIHRSKASVLHAPDYRNKVPALLVPYYGRKMTVLHAPDYKKEIPVFHAPDYGTKMLYCMLKIIGSFLYNTLQLIG